MNENENFVKFLSKRNSKELLKLISLIQMHPQNHGKNLRIETIQAILIQNLNHINTQLNYDGVVNVLLETFIHDYREDPPETSFTENFVFANGNNIVFPGISINSTNMTEGLITSILLTENNIPPEIKRTVNEGLIFMLSVHNEIAKKTGLRRYMSPDNNSDELYFPDESVFNEEKNIFCFNEAEIKAIYTKYGIKQDIIQEFIFDHENEKIDIENVDDIPLIRKPFIKYDGVYYLLLPSSQIHSLNEFIVRIIKESGFEDELNHYHRNAISETRNQLVKMNWKLTDLRTGVAKNLSLNDNESIWQFDKNKLAYVNVLYGEKGGDIEKRANKVIKAVKKKIGRDDYEFMALIILSNYSVSAHVLVMLREIKLADQILMLSLFDLEILINHWNLGSLSLWKYSKAKERASQNGMQFFPHQSILSLYNWYDQNHDSFFHSDEPYNGLILGLDIQAGIIFENNTNNDKHSVLANHADRGMGYIRVFKSEKYAPIYTSEEIFHGVYKKVIKVFNYPIWISCSSYPNSIGNHFIDAIAYWLVELHPLLNETFNHDFSHPLEIVLIIDPGMSNFSMQDIDEETTETFKLEYELKPQEGKVLVKVPKEIYKALHRKDNYAEKRLISFVLHGLNALLNNYDFELISDNHIDLIVNTGMIPQDAKMILTFDSSTDLMIDNRYIPSPYYIEDADESFVLENIINWLGDGIEIPEEIDSKDEKIKILVNAVNIIIEKLREEFQKYNTIELIKFLLYKLEGLVHKREYDKVFIPARISCFSKYTDIVSEYSNSETKRVNSSLTIRCLIEFIVSEPYFGEKLPNNDEIDYLMALMHQLIHFGMVQDSIRFDIDNPKMGLLKSGRLGINHDFYDDILKNYSNENREDELIEYVERFEEQFIDDSNEAPEPSKEFNDIENAFKSDWGISLSEINSISTFLAQHCLSKEQSFMVLKESDFLSLLKNSEHIENQNIDPYLKIVTLESRGKIHLAPEEYERHEVFPWRYNRRLSLIRKPLVKIEKPKGDILYLWSARFIMLASRNLFYQFSKATLKANQNDNNIYDLMSKRKNAKDKSFRNSVSEWLSNNPSLEVIPFEVTIEIKGFLKADKNYGDIDILAFDHKRKKLYAIECKNTKQAKVLYDFHNDLRNYSKKQLPKHINRGEWLKNNLNIVSEKFNKDMTKYKVLPIVISSFQLPIKFMEEIEIPLYSFNEVKRKNIF